MAGTVTTTETMGGGLAKVKFTWLCDSAGAADATTTGVYNAVLLRAIFDPDAAGTQPTDAYDVVVNDADGYDLLGGVGANLTNAANVYKTGTDGLSCCQSSTLTLGVTNAGDAKGGIVTLYLLPINMPG